MSALSLMEPVVLTLTLLSSLGLSDCRGYPRWGRVEEVEADLACGWMVARDDRSGELPACFERARSCRGTACARDPAAPRIEDAHRLPADRRRGEVAVTLITLGQTSCRFRVVVERVASVAVQKNVRFLQIGPPTPPRRCGSARWPIPSVLWSGPRRR